MTETPKMTAAQAAALRKPFPQEVIGKLPKPYKADSPKGKCGECGGYHGLPAVHLDYVGHAAVTDRLLSVDPGWTWEPVATDERGLPALDSKGNLWIRLTVCGVTRLGVGDGKSAKEIVGDAIRNASMRFGVALDLWAKEDLQVLAEERGTQLEDEEVRPLRIMKRTTPPATPPLVETPDHDQAVDTVTRIVGDGDALQVETNPKGLITRKQLQKIGAMFSKLGVTEREERISYVKLWLNLTELESSSALTKSQGSQLIDALQSALDEDAENSPPPVKHTAKGHVVGVGSRALTPIEKVQAVMRGESA